MRKYEILILDDDKSVSDALRDSAEILDIYSATAVSNGAEALRQVEKRRFDAYLVDQRMPAMTGIEFIRALVKCDPDPLVYLITAEDDGVALSEAEKLPEDNRAPIKRYVNKPWPPGLFSVDLREDLRERALKRQVLQALDERAAEERGIQQALSTAHTRLSALERRESAIAGANAVVGAVFHELNNINTGIYGNAYRLGRLAERAGQDPAGEILKPLPEISSSLSLLSSRLQEYTGFIQDLVENVNTPKEAADVAAILDIALADLSADVSAKSLRVHRVYQSHEPLFCYPKQLRHVFYHLLKNAAAASDPSGELWLFVERAQGWVNVRVRDLGRGIPPELAQKIFIPLFTDGKVYGGRGGSIAHRIVTHNHRGKIDLESYTAEMVFSGKWPGVTRGTEVRVGLPVVV